MRRRAPARWRWACSLATCSLFSIVAPASEAGDSVERYIEALRPTLDARVVDALGSIQGTGRQLLALRAYVRSATQLDERWAWTDAQIAAYAASPEKQRLDAAIASVRCHFETANAGYTLFVNDTVRSLDRQVEKWNRSDTIRQSAANMLESFRAELAAPAFPKAASPEGLAAFTKLLLAFRPSPTPTLAAPGLSLHGRMRAIDFQVMAGNGIIAGTDPASVARTWEASGWKAKLQSAVSKADAGFVGPLRNPDEPWHYNFRPGAQVEAMAASAHCVRPASQGVRVDR